MVIWTRILNPALRIWSILLACLCCVGNGHFCRAQDTASATLAPLVADAPQERIAALPVDHQSRLRFTLHFDVDVPPTQEDSTGSLPPVIDHWLNEEFTGATLSVDEFRRLANSLPTRDGSIYADGSKPQRIPQNRLQPIAQHPAQQPHQLDQPTDATASYASGMVQQVGFNQPVDNEKNADKGSKSKGDSESSGEKPPSPEASPIIAEISAIDTVKKLIAQQKELINNNESIDDVVKAAQLEQLNSASTAIQQATVSQALIDLRKSARAKFSERMEHLTELQNTPLAIESPDENATSDSLEIRLQEKRQALQEQVTELNEIKRLLEQREKRITDIPTIRTAVNNRLNTFRQRSKEFESQPDNQEKQFSTLALNAQRIAAQKEIEALDIDLLYQEQFGKPWALDRDIRIRNIKNLESEITKWETAISRSRELEVAEQQRLARKAQEDAIHADPSLQPLAHRNQELAQIRSELTEKINRVGDEVKEVKANFKDTENKLNSIKQIGDTGNLTTSNGMLLVEHRRNLTPTFESQARIEEIRTELQKVRLANLQLTEERDGLATVDEVANQLVESYKNQSTPMMVSVAQFEKMARELATNHRTLLQNLEQDYDIYLNMLADVETNRLNLISKIRETREYIDEKALWVRSSNSVSLSNDLAESRDAMRAYFDRQSWVNLTRHAKEQIIDSPYETALAGFGLIGILVVTRRLRPRDD